MKNIVLLLIIVGCFQLFSCGKESESENFKLLTGPVWASDSLLVNGDDASGPGELLEDFKGDVKFNTDHSGIFGSYTGRWRFAFEETQLVISSDSLPIPLTAIVAELSQTNLKITTNFGIYYIRMTFKAK